MDPHSASACYRVQSNQSRAIECWLSVARSLRITLHLPTTGMCEPSNFGCVLQERVYALWHALPTICLSGHVPQFGKDSANSPECVDRNYLPIASGGDILLLMTQATSRTRTRRTSAKGIHGAAQAITAVVFAPSSRGLF